MKNFIACNETILQVDFAENYSAILQDGVQRVHRSHKQMTLLTCYAWLHRNVTRPVFINNELSHKIFSIWSFLKPILTCFKADKGSARGWGCSLEVQV